MTGPGRRALGKGLGALIPPARYANLRDEYFMCPVARIRADEHQPRQRFDDDALGELVGSIKEKGIIQPLVVRAEGDGYVVVAGERRLRAARRAGLKEVPVVVKEVASEEAFELALIENIQRQDLNAIEEAVAFRRLLDAGGTSQEILARRLGKDRSTVANALRLLRLPAALQQRVIDGQLSAGHARCLLMVEDSDAQRALADRVVDESLSVRQAEALAREAQPGAEAAEVTAPERQPRAPAAPIQPYCDAVARELTDALGTTVTITSRGRKGRIALRFGSIEELRRLRDRIAGSPEPPGPRATGE